MQGVATAIKNDICFFMCIPSLYLKIGIFLKKNVYTNTIDIIIYTVKYIQIELYVKVATQLNMGSTDRDIV
jgi:hypothetical protein